MEFVFAVVIDDGLAFESGNVAPGAKRVLAYCRVPASYTQGEFESSEEPRWPPGKSLTTEAQERLFQALYGTDWRAGNSDGSRYVVLRVEMRAHRTEVAWEPPVHTGADAAFTRHYFSVDSTGAFRATTPEAVIVPAQ